MSRGAAAYENNSVPDEKTLYFSSFKAFTDDIVIVVQLMEITCDRV